MYEKLGELLSESLEKGEVLQFTEEDKFTEEKFSIYENDSLNKKKESSEKPQSKKEKNDSKTEADEAAERLMKKEKEKASAKRNRSEQPKKSTGIVYKKLSPEIERAYRLLDISVSASLEDVKKAYKEKLKYYHPDRHQNNKVLKKVAETKTKQILDAYNLLTDYLGSK